ncbi:MAG: hypothetical protein RI907_1475 [Pseudomonadota bacterium]|jgi:sulfur carrier protein
MSTDITIRTDQGDVKLPAGSTLADAVTALLAGRDVQADQVATAVNGDFVARSARATHALRDGDSVLCFSPITGG